MKLNNSFGISIVETLVALGVLVGVAMTSSFILTSTNVVRKKEEVRATIDQIHILQIQRARRSDILKFSDAPTNLAERLNANQKFCFDGSRSGFGGLDATACNGGFGVTGIPIAADWSDSQVLTGFDINATGYKMFGETNIFSTEVRWRATCPNASRCTSIDVRITTQLNVIAASNLNLAPTAAERKLEPRVTVLSFPAQFFADQVAVRFTCTAGGEIAVTVNNSTHRAVCLPRFATTPNETICGTEHPIQIFGDVVTLGPVAVCNPPANVNCAGGANRGYRRIAYNVKECRNR